MEASADESVRCADGGESGESREDGSGSGTGDRTGSAAGETPAASAAAGGTGPSDPAGAAGAQQVEIPKQQSVGEAADNGAGQGARQ
ncbi:gliding motility protein [Streptomyces spongiicola]|uniref:gliding motility protein n=1 Tax=Streptomyces spongiicola TaxID=1690221 RepID=UPI0033F49D88